MQQQFSSTPDREVSVTTWGVYYLLHKECTHCSMFKNNLEPMTTPMAKTFLTSTCDP